MSSRSVTVSKKYQKKTHLEHIKERPDTYIGSVQPRTEHQWVIVDGKMCFEEITFVPGLYKIFDEILVNAADNKRRDSNMRCIKVNITNDSITVENDGAGIPVVMHDKQNMWVPQMVLGELLSGDNYDDSSERVVGGRNGYGAKLANVFSTTFCVETVDSKANKKYAQTWRNNMSTCSPPKITAANRKDYTRITFAPDFAKFGIEQITPDIRALFEKRVYDIAGTTPKDVRVYLNGQKLAVNNFKQYCSLYFAEDGKQPVYEQVNDRWEVCVALAPDQQHQHVSFCNAIYTPNGGSHVRCVMDDIARHVVPNKAFKDLDVKPGQVKNSTFVFVNALIANPSFDSQTKDALTTRASDFGPVKFKPVISAKFAKSIMKNSGIVEEVLHFAQAKSRRKLTRQTGTSKKSKLTGIPKLDDANFAGTKRSNECTLILTEGDSAKSLAIAGLSVIGRDKYGVFPLKGKLLNVRDANNLTVGNNAEIQNVMKIMGLNIGRSYSETSTLRYGHIMIMTDQDHDGSHIKGLIINFLHHYWPSLLQVPNFLQVFITPIVKCTRGRDVHTFYTTPEYEAWTLENDPQKWKIKYYKGLGTSSAKEAKEYFSNLQKNRLQFEVMQDGSIIDMCFRKARVEDRKQWINSYVPGTHMDFNKKEMTYQDFVDKEYIVMAVQSNLRGIPHVMDGLKPSQRKILFACLKRKLHSEIKVAQLAGYTSEHAAYHHGEASLNGTIVGMAQNYVGSNNINLLVPNGQFGTRLLGGKDAASPRYIFTQLSAVTELIFRPEDAPLYKYLEDDGQVIEPAYYMPIIPMILVNGANGIGTGWSTTVPGYNPEDIIRNIKQMLRGRPPTTMMPWFKDFAGTVKQTQVNKYDIEGKCSWQSKVTLHISELPIGTWTNNYKTFLEEWQEGVGKHQSGQILSVKSDYTDTNVSFTVKMSPQFAATLQGDEKKLKKALKLITTTSTTNMHAFGSDAKMKKYHNVLDILTEFFQERLELYNMRKSYQLKCLSQMIDKLGQKIRFLTDVVNSTISFKGKHKQELIQELQTKGFLKQDNTYDYLLSMPLWNMTHDKIQALTTQNNELNRQMVTLQQQTPEQLWTNDLNELLDSIVHKPNKKRKQTNTMGSNKQSKRQDSP